MESEDFNKLVIAASETVNKPGFDNFDKNDEKFNDIKMK